MSHTPLVILAVLGLSSCQERPRPAVVSAPSGLDGGLAAPTSAPDAASEASGPAAGTSDGGVSDPADLKVVCGDDLRSCQIRGVVRALRAAERPLPSLFGAPVKVRGVLVTLDRTSPPVCAVVALRADEKLQGAPPSVGEVFIALPSKTSLPFAEGESLCGSVHALTLGYDTGEDALLARPDGSVLYARGYEMPRDISPLPGWTFTLGPARDHARREEGYSVDAHDMEVTHGAVTARIPREGRIELRAPEGAYAIEASGYATAGPLPPWMLWLSKQGFGFTIVRVGP
jgi:hypothetical protein